MDKEFYCIHSELCKTLANAKRQEILDILRTSERNVNQLVELTGIPQANLSQHLAILRTKGVLTSTRRGANVFYSIANPKIIQAFDLLTEVMQEQQVKADKAIDEGVAYAQARARQAKEGG
jgi:ArsR family transcriptional regulator, virulence genes transcriptional regulator